MKLLFVTPDLSSNSLGRTHTLWSLANALGWSSRIVSTRGDRIWQPLAGSPFINDCTLISLSEDGAWQRLDDFARSSDLIIAVKPLDESLGIAHTLRSRTQQPLLLDIDDPDLSASLSLGKPPRMMLKTLRHPRAMAARWRRYRLASTLDVIVSNPVLQAFHGGAIVPHARVDGGFGAPHTTRRLAVAFVGTNRDHKGVPELRSAVARLQNELNISLTVTDSRPGDAKPWEHWIGMTSIEDGLDVVRQSDVIILASRRTAFAQGQLPAKLIDAMIAGRAIAVSNIEPMPWAVGDAGLILEPHSADSIVAALRTFSDAAVRTEHGQRARKRALEYFTIERCAEAFRNAVESSIRRQRVTQGEGPA